MLKRILLTTILLPVCAHAQDSATIVTITREPLAISQIGQPVDVLTAEDIRQYQSLFVTDLLTRTTDLDIARNGGPGEAAAASIRGAGADHTLYLLDGVRLNDPSQVGGGTNLGLITTGDADRIEVLRGPLSTLWGSGALGGVVSITSHTPDRPLESVLSLEGFDRYGSARAAIGGKSGNLTWGLNGAVYADQGVSAFVDGTEKDGFAQSQLGGRIAYDFGVTMLNAFIHHSHSRNDYDGYPPPLYAFADTGDFGKTDTTIGAVGLTNRYAHGEQTLSLSASDTGRYDYYEGAIPSFSAHGRIQTADYHAVWRTGSTRLLGGVSTERDSMTGDTAAHTTLSSLYGQVAHDFGPLEATLSARHDDASSFGSLGIAQISLSAPLGPVRLHASAGTGVKVPSLYQLYSPYGTPDLTPEKAISLDAGADLVTPRGIVTAAVFSRTVRDLIDFVACDGARCANQPYGYYANIDRSKASGVELETRQDFGAVTVTANYSWLTTENRSPGLDGNRLPRTPDQLGSADIAWRATGRLTLGAGARHVGASFDDAWNTRRLKGYTLADLRMSWDLNDRLTLYGRIENAGDTRYETAADYGQSGRRVWIGLRTRIF